MNKCDTCKNKGTHICLQCFIIGGNPTYVWYEPVEEEDNK